MKDTYVIATRRLPLRVRRAIPGSRAMGWDTDRPYHYFRWTNDGRLLVGGADTNHHVVKGSRKRISKARARLIVLLAQVYPLLAEESPAYAWEGLFAETPDGLPYIGTHSRYPKAPVCARLRRQRDDRLVSCGDSCCSSVSDDAARAQGRRSDT